MDGNCMKMATEAFEPSDRSCWQRARQDEGKAFKQSSFNHTEDQIRTQVSSVHPSYPTNIESFI